MPSWTPAGLTLTRRQRFSAADADFKRYQELFLPLQDDVSRALDAYAKARGITLIIDASQTPILYAAESIDVTQAFISEYNSKNPAAGPTAQGTPPK